MDQKLASAVRRSKRQLTDYTRTKPAIPLSANFSKMPSLSNVSRMIVSGILSMSKLRRVSIEERSFGGVVGKP
jgi:hypothetical protein